MSRVQGTGAGNGMKKGDGCEETLWRGRLLADAQVAFAEGSFSWKGCHVAFFDGVECARGG